MKVQLLAKTQMLDGDSDVEKLISTAAKVCYSANDIDTILQKNSASVTDNMIDKIMSSGHFSVLEHVSFTFSVEGVSRALLAQLSRHRLISLSVKSQRYVSESGFEYVMPDSFETAEQKEFFDTCMSDIQYFYDTAIKLGIPKEDARYFLSNATCTSFVMTMNLRELLHVISLRTCLRAQAEIVELFEEVYRCVYPYARRVLFQAGPDCVSTGKCSEGAMCCGKSVEQNEKWKSLRGE